MTQRQFDKAMREIRTRAAAANRHPVRLDPISELGCLLLRPIPAGDDFTDWISDDQQLRMVIKALGFRQFSWDEIRTALFDMTRQRWLPSVDQIKRIAA